ncbi:MAG: DUF3107 domain-containing protein [Actinomycetales bacterium]
MEVKIGVQNVARELVLETDESAKEVGAKVAKALSGSALELSDTKGRMLVVPASALAYVEIGVEEQRRVGFGGS